MIFRQNYAKLGFLVTFGFLDKMTIFSQNYDFSQSSDIYSKFQF